MFDLMVSDPPDLDFGDPEAEAEVVLSDGEEAAWHAWLAAGQPQGPSRVPYPCSPVQPWSGEPADGLLWHRLAATGPGSLFDRAERIGAWVHLIAAATGQMYTELVGYHHALAADPGAGPRTGEQVFASTASTYALMARLPAATAKAHLNEALALAVRLPATLSALRAGTLGLTSARAIAEETAVLAGEDCAAVEAKVLPDAAEQTPGQIRAATKRAALQADPDTADKRVKQARRRRRVDYTPARDAMAWVSALLPAETAASIWAVLNGHADACAGPGQSRSYDQRRADAFADMFLHPPTGEAAQVKVHLHVVVTAAGLLGLDHQPAALAGYGPIPAELARTLAADATWSRILTDPAGKVTESGGRHHRPPAATARKVRARDQHCRSPGRRRPVYQCDLDHTIPHAASDPTTEPNLAALCRFHHRVKHIPGWGLKQDPGGKPTLHHPGRAHLPLDAPSHAPTRRRTPLSPRNRRPRRTRRPPF